MRYTCVTACVFFVCLSVWLSKTYFHLVLAANYWVSKNFATNRPRLQVLSTYRRPLPVYHSERVHVHVQHDVRDTARCADPSASVWTFYCCWCCTSWSCYYTRLVRVATRDARVYTCTRVHDNESCTRLPNYTVVYTNMASGQNSALTIKNRLKQSSVQLTAKLSNNWMNYHSVTWTSLKAAEVTSQAAFAGRYSR